MQQDERRCRFAFWVPWTEIDWSERLDALTSASEIIFSDKSAVLWNGVDWDVDFRYLLEPLTDPEAEQFIAERLEVAKSTPL